MAIIITDFRRRKSLQIGFRSGGNTEAFKTQSNIYDGAFCENSQRFGKHCAGVFSLIKLLAALKKETPVLVFSCEFCEIFKNKGTPPFDCFWIEQYNNYIILIIYNKMKRLHIKHNYSLPHFIQFKKSFFIEHLRWLLLDIYTIF